MQSQELIGVRGTLAFLWTVGLLREVKSDSLEPRLGPCTAHCWLPRTPVILNGVILIRFAGCR